MFGYLGTAYLSEPKNSQIKFINQILRKPNYQIQNVVPVLGGMTWFLCWHVCVFLVCLLPGGLHSGDAGSQGSSEKGNAGANQKVPRLALSELCFSSNLWLIVLVVPQFHICLCNLSRAHHHPRRGGSPALQIQKMGYQLSQTIIPGYKVWWVSLKRLWLDQLHFILRKKWAWICVIVSVRILVRAPLNPKRVL